MTDFTSCFVTGRHLDYWRSCLSPVIGNNIVDWLICLLTTALGLITRTAMASINNNQSLAVIDTNFDSTLNENKDVNFPRGENSFNKREELTEEERNRVKFYAKKMESFEELQTEVLFAIYFLLMVSNIIQLAVLLQSGFKPNEEDYLYLDLEEFHQ